MTGIPAFHNYRAARWADMPGIEAVMIDNRSQLRWNELSCGRRR
jgi:L-arabinose isomerase